MTNNIKKLNKLLILIHIGIPIIYFALFVKFKTPIFYIISFIYILLPLFIIANNKKNNKKKSWQYHFEINNMLKNHLIFGLSLIISIIWITYIINNIEGHQDYGSGFLIMFIIFINIVSWFIFMGLLLKNKDYLNSSCYE